MINWKTTKEEYALISDIVNAAVEQRLYTDARECMMDLTAVHCNGNKLRLAELLAAAGTKDETFDFSHDLLGIRRHIDRTTGKLGDFFTPRFSV